MGHDFLAAAARYSPAKLIYTDVCVGVSLSMKLAAVRCARRSPDAIAGAASLIMNRYAHRRRRERIDYDSNVHNRLA